MALASAAVGLLAALLLFVIGGHSVGRAISGGDPYSVPLVVSTNPDPNVVETTLTAELAPVDIGGGVTANAMTFNGSIPGPTFMLKVGDTVIVHFQNHLSIPSGIHWHGIELSNEMDGTPYTQDGVAPGGNFTYIFKVNRPGIYWYHPHNSFSTDAVFAGMYGMIVVTDPNEAALQASGTLPSAADTKPIVLSDTTVCKAPGTNDTMTYNPALPWVGGGALPNQMGPTPKTLCETPTAIDLNGNLRATPYQAGDIPAIQQNSGAAENEGQTVLTNGKNVGGRGGTPSAPGALASGASTLDVRPGQGLRLELVNASAIRYFRLHLTTAAGADVPLIRVGGEGGLLDYAVQEGNMAPLSSGYNPGEILLPPGSRADVVAAIPPSPTTGVLTMWTEDYQRTGMAPGWSDIPTVPVMHLNLAGTPVAPAYSISDGTPLRAATGDLVPALGAPTGTLLDPTTFSPPKLGMASQTISFTVGGGKAGIDGVFGVHDTPNYETAPHLGSTRYAKVGDTLQLSVTNATAAHHPFHLHGFEIQPVSLTNGVNTYTWPYHEFRDNVDIPGGDTLVFRVKIDDRPLPDGTTPGGVYGRWLFHCHIFFHAELGMLSELVIVPPNGKERPDINVGATQVQVSPGQTATVTGTYFDPDGDPVTLSASVGAMSDTGGGNYTWSFPTGARTTSQWVYLTATNSAGLKAQMPVYLQVNDLGPPTLMLPASESGVRGKPLTFGISASDPDAVDVLTLGASGLPAGLTFKDNGNRTGTVSGTVIAPPGVYMAGFSATDGKTTPAVGTVRITITAPVSPPPPELTAVVGKQLKLSGGAITVGCRVLNPSIRSCTVTVLVGGKRVGSATVTLRRRGKQTVTVKIKLNKKTLGQIAKARHGVKVKLHLVATKFGSRTAYTANAQTTVVRGRTRR